MTYGRTLKLFWFRPYSVAAGLFFLLPPAAVAVTNWRSNPNVAAVGAVGWAVLFLALPYLAQALRRSPAPARIVIEGTVDYKPEDDGQALVATVHDGRPVFVRIQSWDETRQHQTALRLAGKRVRVVIEEMP